MNYDIYKFDIENRLGGVHAITFIQTGSIFEVTLKDGAATIQISKAADKIYAIKRIWQTQFGNEPLVPCLTTTQRDSVTATLGQVILNIDESYRQEWWDGTSWVLSAGDNWELKTSDEGALTVFSGTPDIESTSWDSADFVSYRKVIGTGASQKGGLVYEFVIPDGVVSILAVSVTGKVGAVAAGNQINIRVYREDGTQIDTGGPYTITAATMTIVSITTFSGATFVAGERFVVEVEGQVDDTEEVFISKCSIKLGR